ncbi:signal peptidase I [Candidatus Saccharibacteria bacterium]|nr:signal peptidase I [Candidatus Saccharibacteria bacterium]
MNIRLRPQLPGRRPAPPAATPRPSAARSDAASIRPLPLDDAPDPLRIGRGGSAPRLRGGSSRLRSALANLGLIGCVVGIALFINTFLLQSYYVEGTSMAPTLHNNDRLIVDKASASAAHITGKPYQPQRGDIVIVDSRIRDQNGEYEQLIKRVVGLPGERLAISDGKIMVYNKEHPEGFDVDKQLGLELDPTFTPSLIDLTIPKGEVFVVGDNRQAGGSLDSRIFGPVKLDTLDGRLMARIFPLSGKTFF